MRVTKMYKAALHVFGGFELFSVPPNLNSSHVARARSPVGSVDPSNIGWIQSTWVRRMVVQRSVITRIRGPMSIRSSSNVFRAFGRRSGFSCILRRVLVLVPPIKTKARFFGSCWRFRLRVVGRSPVSNVFHAFGRRSELFGTFTAAELGLKFSGLPKT